MKAVRLHAFGPASNLVYEEVDDPKPGPGQVRVAVAVAGVHFIDTVIRSGGRQDRFGVPELPMIPGREVAGTVDALGPDTDLGWLGRLVVASGASGGGYAELAVCDASILHAVPDGMALDTAVAMVGTGRTTIGILEHA